jgi:hypothetical protein
MWEWVMFEIRVAADVRGSVVTGDKKKSGIIRKYGINMSRQAFREKAQDIGFVKVCRNAQKDGFLLNGEERKRL